MYAFDTRARARTGWTASVRLAHSIASSCSRRPVGGGGAKGGGPLEECGYSGRARAAAACQKRSTISCLRVRDGWEGEDLLRKLKTPNWRGPKVGTFGIF